MDRLRLCSNIGPPLPSIYPILRWLLVVVTVGTVLTSTTTLAASSTQLEPAQSPPGEHVCGSVRLKNFVESLRLIENCTVIEGYLKIVLIENAKPHEFDALSFPKLREVTNYLLIYRVYGLRSLSQLFPNLSVIRGQLLFHSYALVIVEVPELLDVGLGSLTRIVRGAVRIEKNPQLCYVSTIDWPALTGVHRSEHFILQNKDPSQCANTCPTQPHACPQSTEVSSSGAVVTQSLCWNARLCQKVCPQSCASVGGGACLQQLSSTSTAVDVPAVEYQCCHPECLGGCWGPGSEKCTACVNVSSRGECLPQCPNGSYNLVNRRCITESECRSIRYGSDMSRGMVLHEGRCIPECPQGYMLSKEEKNRCTKCPGHCPKICNGIVVHNIAAAQRFKGCTIIKGNIIIEISGGFKVNEELEESLGMIEEVTQYVKVSRSYPITSLRFLRSLRVIRGEGGLFNHRYALLVYQNENLQDMWDLSTMNLTVLQGSIFLQFNPKLCINKVNALVEHLGMSKEVDRTDIYPESNGNDISCYRSVLTLELVAVTSRGAYLRWKNVNLTNNRALISWVVNYRPTSEENISLSSLGDTCKRDLWKSVDVTNQMSNSTDMGVILQDLEPFTKYAVYVLSYSTMMSQILYFRTEPSEPSPARNVTAIPRYPGELHVSWKGPSSPNGNITHYYVYWQPQPLHEKMFERRDYCGGKLRTQLKPKPTEPPVVDTVKNTTVVDGSVCCTCPKSKEELDKEEKERRYQTEFENFLLESLYRRKPVNLSYENFRLGISPPQNGSVLGSTPNPFDSDVWGASRSTDVVLMAANFSSPSNRSEMVAVQPYEAAIVYGQREIILTNLKHYQEYNIEVVACQEHDNGINSKACSNRAIVSARTLADDNADNIEARNISVANGTSNNVWIQWAEPRAPNGLVVLYDVELTRVDVPNYKPDIYCISQRMFRQDSGYMSQILAAGNWSVRIRATSLAGNGSWTERRFFQMAQAETMPPPMTVGAIVGVTLSCIVVVVVSLVILGIWIQKKRIALRMTEDRLDVLSANPHYAFPDDVYIQDEWEVSREKIKLGRAIGQGSFGSVYEGIAIDLVAGEPKAKVAIKTVNENASRRDRIAFLNEASIMKRFECHHVVRLFGVVSVGQPPLVIMELMQNGDLKSFLRARRPDETDPGSLRPLTLQQMLQMAGEIADGMAYLSSIKFVHRDLAARNCMVAANYTVKIGDFGMARDIYVTDYYRKDTQGLLPVRWMAPESLHDGVFTTASDVWSFGVVLWEMATLAEQPYQGRSHEEVLTYVVGGRVLDKPDICPDILYELMIQCWRHSPSRRPTFIDILDHLVPHLSDAFRAVSYYNNQPPEHDPPPPADPSPDNTSPDSKIGGNTHLERVPPGKSTSPVADDQTGLLSGDSRTPERTRSSLHPAVETAKPTAVPVSAKLAENISLVKPLLADTKAAQKRTDPDPYANCSIGQISSTDVLDGKRGNPVTGNFSDAYSKETKGINGSCGSSSSGGIAGGRKNGFVNGHVIPYDCLPEARC